MKVKGLIFDLDGTLLDTIEDIGDSMNQVLREYGRDEFSYDEYRIKVGGGFTKLIYRCFGEDMAEEEVDEILERLEDVYQKRYMKKSAPYKNIEKLLEELEKRSIKLGINTNKKEEYSHNLIGKIFPTINFIENVGQRSDAPTKPDPFGALKVLEALGLEKDEVLFIGDSNVDILTGKNAGIKTVGVDWGFRGEEELREYGADHIVYNPLEILDLI